MRITPWLNSISSPGRTSLLGLAGAPLTFTRPPRMASTASARVFTSRAAHNHLSMRTGCVSIVRIFKPTHGETATSVAKGVRPLKRQLSRKGVRPSLGWSVLEPALERRAADERDFAVAVDPVADAQLADEAERVAGAGPVAVGGEHARARFDRPAAGIERGERAALLVGRDVQRTGARAAQRILPARGRGRGVRPRGRRRRRRGRR